MFFFCEVNLGTSKLKACEYCSQDIVRGDNIEDVDVSLHGHLAI